MNDESRKMVTGTRYAARQFTVQRVWGVWDAQEDSWHIGDYDNARYAAGVPCWDLENDALFVTHLLNN